MRIQHNITAMNAHRQYGINNATIAKSVEKLSSGYRINRAGDDAAGLAISEKMRAQIRGLTMASKNSQDAISLVQTAEGALQSTHDILQRMRELAVQSASDSNEQVIDRGALEKEFAQLKKEINDIAGKTRFNDQNLIDGTFQKATKVLGDGTDSGFLGKLNSISVARAANPGTYSITAATVDSVKGGPVTGAAGTGTPNAIDGGNGDVAALTDAGAGKLEGATWVFTPSNTAAHNGNTYHMKVTGDDAKNLTFELIDSNGNSVAMARNIDVTVATAANGTNKAAKINFDGVGTFEFTLANDKESLTNADISSLDSLFGADIKFTDDGKDPVIAESSKGYLELKVDQTGETIRLYKGDTVANFANSGIAFSFDALSDAQIKDVNTFTANMNIEVKQIDGKSMIIQTGANQGDELSINIDKMNTDMLGISFSSIASQRDASKAITEVNTALNEVSTQRATLGALQNRLEYKIANLDTSAENLQAAEGRIRDVDMAKEMTEFTKKNILAQASTAMLAQANALPQGVLQLLG